MSDVVGKFNKNKWILYVVSGVVTILFGLALMANKVLVLPILRDIDGNSQLQFYAITSSIGGIAYAMTFIFLGIRLFKRPICSYVEGEKIWTNNHKLNLTIAILGIISTIVTILVLTIPNIPEEEIGAVWLSICCVVLGVIMIALNFVTRALPDELEDDEQVGGDDAVVEDSSNPPESDKQQEQPDVEPVKSALTVFKSEVRKLKTLKNQGVMEGEQFEQTVNRLVNNNLLRINFSKEEKIEAVNELKDKGVLTQEHTAQIILKIKGE